MAYATVTEIAYLSGKSNLYVFLLCIGNETEWILYYNFNFQSLELVQDQDRKVMSEIFEISHSPKAKRMSEVIVRCFSLGVLNDNCDRSSSLKFFSFHYDVTGVNDSRNKAQDGQANVDEEVAATPSSTEDSKGWKYEGQDEQAAIRTRHLRLLLKGSSDLRG